MNATTIQAGRRPLPPRMRSEQEQDAYKRGFERGFNCASWQNLPEVGEEIWTDGEGEITVDEDNQWDVVQSPLHTRANRMIASSAPFEFTAHEFNESEDADESLGSIRLRHMRRYHGQHRRKKGRLMLAEQNRAGYIAFLTMTVLRKGW